MTPGPDANCGYAVQPGQRRSLPVDGALYEFQWDVQIDYFSSAAADVTVTTDQQSVDLTLAASPAGGIARLQYVVVDSVGKLDVELAEDAEPLCITVVKVGGLSPTDRRPAPLSSLD